MKEALSEQEIVALYRSFYIIGDNANLKILYELDTYGEKTFTELKTALNINPSTLTKKLRLLVRVGLVTSDKTHDRLRVYYALNQHQRPLRRVLHAIERLSQDLS